MDALYRQKELLLVDPPLLQIGIGIFVHKGRQLRLEPLRIGTRPQLDIGKEHIVDGKVGRVAVDILLHRPALEIDEETVIDMAGHRRRPEHTRNRIVMHPVRIAVDMNDLAHGGTAAEIFAGHFLRDHHAVKPIQRMVRAPFFEVIGKHPEIRGIRQGHLILHKRSLLPARRTVFQQGLVIERTQQPRRSDHFRELLLQRRCHRGRGVGTVMRLLSLRDKGRTYLVQVVDMPVIAVIARLIMKVEGDQHTAGQPDR